MAASTSGSLYSHGDTTLSPSAAPSIAGATTLYSSSTTTQTSSLPSTSLSGTDHLRDVFHKRIRSLSYLKHSLQGQRTWFQAIQLDQAELASAFDNERMHRRTLRYSLLGLSLSSILEIPNPSDMARAIVSLINELDGYTDDNIISLTSSVGAANFGTQKKMRNFFSKSGKQTIKRSTAVQAINEFGVMDSNTGPASTLSASEQSSYLMTPNIPFQLDFFQTFFTLCDMLTEIYYKMLSFLPKDTSAYGGDVPGNVNHSTLPRAASRPPSASGHGSQDHERTASISHAAMVSQIDGTDAEGEKPGLPSTTPLLSGMTQELLLKADAKIKKTIHAQVKDIDVAARQMIRDEFASLDPLMKTLGLDTMGSTSTFLSSAGSVGSSIKSGSSVGGLPSTSASSLPFGFTTSPPPTNPLPAVPGGSVFRTPEKNPPSSHFRRTPKQDQDAHPGHHHFNLASEASPTSGGAMLRTKSGGKLRRMLSTDRPPSSGGGSPSTGTGNTDSNPALRI